MEIKEAMAFLEAGQAVRRKLWPTDKAIFGALMDHKDVHPTIVIVMRDNERDTARPVFEVSDLTAGDWEAKTWEEMGWK